LSDGQQLIFHIMSFSIMTKRLPPTSSRTGDNFNEFKLSFLKNNPCQSKCVVFFQNNAYGESETNLRQIEQPWWRNSATFFLFSQYFTVYIFDYHLFLLLDNYIQNWQFRTREKKSLIISSLLKIRFLCS